VTDNPALTNYDPQFYAEQADGSLRSSQVVVPRLLEMFPQVKSVVDVGCGVGTWLATFKRCGVEQVRGIDGGSPESEALAIAEAEYIKADFTQDFAEGISADLALTLEVAEHFDREYAEHFVKSLCAISDLVVFGAAIPGQGGTHHVNERWPSYWEDIFNSLGYSFYDVLRQQHWHDQRIEWWYRQNTFVVIKDSRRDLVDQLTAYQQQLPQSPPRDCVHPQMYLIAKQHAINVEKQNRELRETLDQMLNSNIWRLLRGPRATYRLLKKLIKG